MICGRMHSPICPYNTLVQLLMDPFPPEILGRIAQITRNTVRAQWEGVHSVNITVQQMQALEPMSMVWYRGVFLCLLSSGGMIY